MFLYWVYVSCTLLSWFYLHLFLNLMFHVSFQKKCLVHKLPADVMEMPPKTHIFKDFEVPRERGQTCNIFYGSVGFSSPLVISPNKIADSLASRILIQDVLGERYIVVSQPMEFAAISKHVLIRSKDSNCIDAVCMGPGRNN